MRIRSMTGVLAVMALVLASVASATSPPQAMTREAETKLGYSSSSDDAQYTGGPTAPATIGTQMALETSSAAPGSLVPPSFTVFDSVGRPVGAYEPGVVPCFAPIQTFGGAAGIFAGSIAPPSSYRCTMALPSHEVAGFDSNGMTKKRPASGDKFARPRLDVFTGATAHRAPMRV